MPANPYDQACRYLMRLDPIGLLRWLFASTAGTLRFLGWLETRNIPFPGEADRIGDLVACLEVVGQPGPLWAVPIEFQSEPDAEMFGRLLEYLGSLWRQKRPPDRPGERYSVVGCLVNLTGTGDCRRDFHFGAARTLLEPQECNLATKDAAATLNAIASGEVTRCVLPFIPLMHQGNQDVIIRQWLEVACAEADDARRGDFGGLALVFAELADCHAPWHEALKGWNVKQSKQVLEWQAEAELRFGRQALRIVLQERFGALSEALLQRINAVDDVERLQEGLRQVAKIKSADELVL